MNGMSAGTGRKRRVQNKALPKTAAKPSRVRRRSDLTIANFHKSAGCGCRCPRDRRSWPRRKSEHHPSTQALTFPNGVNPRDVIFGADHIQGEEVLLLRVPLEVMQASEVGETASTTLREPDVHISNCSKTRVIESDRRRLESGVFYYGWSSHKATSLVQSARSQKSVYEKRPNRRRVFVPSRTEKQQSCPKEKAAQKWRCFFFRMCPSSMAGEFV
jgi:hypothetical protein